MDFKKRMKRCIAFFLALIMLLSAFIGYIGSDVLKTESVEAAANTTKVTIGQTIKICPIAEIKSGKCIISKFTTSENKQIFCLNAGKALDTGDTLTYTTYNAVTYSNQGLAKGLTYYFKTLGGYSSQKNHIAVQAYMWACGKGVSKETAVYQALCSIEGVSAARTDAEKIVKAISKTDPEGTVYDYKATKCSRGRSLSSHQNLVGWSSASVSPEYDSVKYSDRGTGSEEIKITINKRDSATRKKIDTAVYKIACDGKTVKSDVSTSKGTASFTYTRSLKTDTYTSSKKYVKNWNELSVPQQKACTGNGYYSSKAKAKAAAESEVKKKIAKALAALKEAVHTWKVTETSAPKGHAIAKSAISKKERENLSFDFSNKPKYGHVTVTKASNTSDTGNVATLKGAVYGIYAGEDIYDTDNRTVLHKKDSLVSSIVTNAKGVAKSKNILPIDYSYYVKETTPSKGFGLDKAKHAFAITYNSSTRKVQSAAVTSTEPLIQGYVEVYKTKSANGNRQAETEAIFQIYDSKKKPAGTVTTTTVKTVSGITYGYGKSALLPYGTYTLVQVKGAADHSFAADKTFTVKKHNTSSAAVTYYLDNPEENCEIEVVKTKTADDPDTGTYESSAEQGAVFYLLDANLARIKDADISTAAKRQEYVDSLSSDAVVQRLVTDADGTALSRRIEPGDYVILQASGEDGYALADPKTVTVKQGETYRHTYSIDDPQIGTRFVIHKTKSRSQVTAPEEDAQFYVLDMSGISLDGVDLSTADARQEFVAGLSSNAVIDIITTDEKGDASTYFASAEHPDGFLVLQTGGEEGYRLMDPLYSDDLTPEVDAGHENILVYEFSYTDEFDEYAFIGIRKTYQANAADFLPEEGAVFEILDSEGQIVETVTTDRDGYAVTSKELSYGQYTIHQVSGMPGHSLAADAEIFLSRQDKHSVYEYECKDPADEYLLKLRKLSEETGILVDGAVYEVRDAEGNVVASMQTGADGESGTASCTLPYGTYSISETVSPDRYVRDPETYTFILDADGITFEGTTTPPVYDEDGVGTVGMELRDVPIYGTVTIRKSGNALTGYSDQEAGFTYDTAGIAGASYDLYANEDIRRDDGTVVWTAGTKVSSAVTGADGTAEFTWNKDGVQTTDFYLGNYYVIETGVPYGYTLDPEKHEVNLTWDAKAQDMNDIRDTTEVEDVGDPCGNNSPYASTGAYILCTGETLNPYLKDAEKVTFTWKSAPAGAAVRDVSSAGDKSIVLWTSGTEVCISTQKSGQVIYLNAISSGMFCECSSLKEISFDNVDTSRAVDMSSMFYKCILLETLDLSSFNTAAVENMSHMFYGCTSLTTIYVKDHVFDKKDEVYTEPVIRSITAAPRRVFALGDAFCAEDFVFTAHYSDGSQEEISITDTDIASYGTPTAVFTGDAAYTDEDHCAFVMSLPIRLASSSVYARYGKISAKVTVEDPDAITASDRIIKKARADLQLTDTLQNLIIRVEKVDGDGERLSGAVFGLYANADIMDAYGNKLFRAGDLIMTAESSGGNSGYLEFLDLPTDRYAAAGTYAAPSKNTAGCQGKGPDYLYCVREISAPLGYRKDDRALYYSGAVAGTAGKITYHSTVENEKLPYLTIHKEWEDSPSSDRPRYVSFKVSDSETKRPLNVIRLYERKAELYSYSDTVYAGGSGTPLKTYTLEEPWTLVTELDPDLVRLEENEDILPEGYSNTFKNFYPKINTYWFTNSDEHLLQLSVTKVWQDEDNADGIRPKSISVTLYADGKPRQTAELSAAVNWTKIAKGLKQYNEDGSEIVYEWRETMAGAVNGDSATGYAPGYSKTVEEDGTIATTISNYHRTQELELSVEKTWEDEEDADGIRPDAVYMKLMADGVVSQAVELNEKNHWSATVGGLPSSKNGKKITYTWEEAGEGETVTVGKKEHTVSGSFLTGEPEIGYQAFYHVPDGNTTVVANTHSRTDGEITALKQIRASEINFGFCTPAFTFVLSGTDVYGRFHTYSKTVTFTEEYVKDHTDPDGTVKAAVKFDGLVYGDYTLEESGSEYAYQLEGIDATNGSVSPDGRKAVFHLAPESKDQAFQALFRNQAYLGSITLAKYDSDGKTRLPAVSFEIRDAAGKLAGAGKTNKNGTLSFGELVPGTYTVRETATADGRELLAEPVEVTVPVTLSPAEAAEQDADLSSAVYAAGRYYFYDLTYRITNTAQLDLPDTGGAYGWNRYLPAMALVMAAFGGCCICRRKRRNRKNQNRRMEKE